MEKDQNSNERTIRNRCSHSVPLLNKEIREHFLIKIWMKYRSTLLAVKDRHHSIQFYKKLFNQEVVLGLRRHATLSGEFCIQKDCAWLTNISIESISDRVHNMELYFEVDDFMTLLENYPEVGHVHAPKMHNWIQRVIADHHMIEIKESMTMIARYYLSNVYSI
ncbi:MAG: hypothetical protein RR356_05845 [Bacteroidales bacterium]